MKKRTLKQQAKYIKKKIQEEDKCFYEETIKQNCPKKTIGTKRLFAIFAPTFVAALTLVLCLVFLLPQGTPIEPIPPKQYLSENEKSKDSDITELTQNASNFQIDFGTYDYSVHLFYDSESNDTLFFTAHITINDFEKATIHFYINPDYTSIKQLSSDTENKTIGVFSVEYEKHVENNDGLYTVEHKAKTQYQGITIFIDHSQLSLDEESNFFDFFAQTIKTTE